MNRYYIAWSSRYDNPKVKYDIPRFKRILKNLGCKYIRTSYCYGWANQPKVVCFNAHDSLFRYISELLDDDIIQLKTW
jgi:hypothetical protein